MTTRFDEARAAVHALALTPVTDRSHDPEHVLHELAHAVTLGIAPTFELTRAVGDSLNPIALGGLRRLTAYERILTGASKRSDLNEIRTIAVEKRAGLLAGIEVGTASDIIASGGLLVTGADTAARMAYRMMWSEATYRAAVRALDMAPVVLRLWDEHASASGLRPRLEARPGSVGGRFL